MIEVKETPEGKWGVYLDGYLLADSKLRCAADLAKRVIDNYVIAQRSDRPDTAG